MKKNVFFWRYLTLIVMLFGAVSASHADTNKIAGELTSNSETVTAAAVVNLLPADGELEVANGTFLTWDYAGSDVTEYKVVLGTTYPPTNVVVDFTEVVPTGDSYELTDLEPNLQYFWQVVVTDGTTTVEGDIWGFTRTITPAMNVTAAGEELFVGDDVVLSWESPLEGFRSFLGYNVYRDGVKINDALVAGLTFTDDDAIALVYNMTGYTYNVTSLFSEGESAYSTDVLVKISGEGAIAGTVTEEVAGAVIADATLTIEGTDEFGNDVSYTANSNATGDYTQTVKVGEYNMAIVAEGYIDGASTEVAVVYNTTTTEDVVLSEVAYALANVVATELDDDEVHLEWTFEASTRELVDFTIYRGLWNQDFADFTLVGNTTQNQFVDYDWGIQTSGVYRWAIVANYSLSQSVPTFSAPLLDKNMETVVNVAVTLNSAETPAGTEVTLANISEEYLELEYTTTLTETGLFTFDNFRKGTYEVSVNLFGYKVVNEIEVVSEETDLTYLLVELLNAATDLYVNPNGYATWGTPSEGGLESFSTDFTGGIPAEITVTNNGDDVSIWKYSSSAENARSGYSSFAGFTDTRMNTPIIVLDENTVVEFDWYIYAYTDTELTMDISFNNGLTWITMFTASTSGVVAGSWNTTTIDVAALGYNTGSAIFSAHKTDVYGWSVNIDNWYMGPATATASTVAISDNISAQNITRENLDSAIAGLRIFDHNSLALNAEASRSLETFKVSLDDVFSENTTDLFYDYEVEETLVEGTVYTAKVEADYTTGLSEPMEYTFTYHTCAYYNAVADLTATRVEGTMNIELAWTNNAAALDTDEFVGTKVYRDGVYVETVAAGTSTFTDEGLTSGDYTYTLTQIYASDAESCEVNVVATMTAGGYVNGYVKEFAGDNAPIEGATVTLTGATASFSFNTDATGYYEGEIVEGTFDYEVTAATYTSETLETVVIDFGATVVKDFLLKEYAYTVGTVVATEMNDNTVQVDWSGTGGGGGSIEEWLRYDDGTNEDGIGGVATFSWATKYDPSQLTDLAGTSVTKIQLFNRTTVANKLQIFEGTDAATLIYEQDLTGLTFEEWNEVVLTTAVPIDVTKELWITIYTEDGLTFPAATGPTMGEANGDLISLDGVVWEHLTDYDLSGTWNLATFVTDVNDRTVALGNVTNTVAYKTVNTSDLAATGVKNHSVAAILPNSMRVASSTRALAGYNVYRGTCGSVDEDMTFMGYTLDMQFTDNTWGAATEGIYSWAVEAVYDYNEAEYVYSNCLDKDMITSVSVIVTANSSDSPEGTDVMFTNVSEPTDPILVYDVELDATGMYTWDEFRKGTYNIFVHKSGFADITVEGVSIWEVSEFTYVLEELLAPVSDLYVNPLGFATWRAGGVVPFEAVFENFDAGLPETWTVTYGPNSETDANWENVTDYGGNSLDGTAFMFIDSDAAGFDVIDGYLSSDIVDADGTDDLFVEFDQYFNQIGSSDFANVEVFDGTDWVEVLAQTSDVGSWSPSNHTVIDVSAYANAAFQVRFHYSGDYSWYWAIDNFAVTEGDSRYADRELQNYKVWHNYTFITDTDTTFYQYGDNEEVLVPGETYMAEVAAIYSTGMSEKMFYEWTYYPCDSFAGPAQFIAENVETTKDVLLTWSDILPMSLVTISQNPGVAANGYYQSYDLGYGVVYDLAAYPDALASTIEFHHDSWGTTGPHDYNIHIINWDTEEVLAVLGPFATTGDDQWEMDVQLGDVNLNGAANVAFLMEPLSNSAADAYPDMSSDNAADPQGSVYGSLDDIGAIGASTIGNFLMNISIMTANGPVRVSSTQLDIPVAVAATPRVGLGTVVTETVITKQVSTREVTETFMGANLYRDGEMIAEMVMDTFYVDAELVPDFYDYCIKFVYESGAMSCGTCVNDVMVPENCVAPKNLTATLNQETYDDIFLAWNQEEQVEYRYDDGVSTGQLGSGSGTTNTLLGNVHRVDASLNEMSWYLTAEGGPHSNIDIWVLGLDAAGVPDGNNVLFTSSVSNTDEQWNTFTFNNPIDITGGFFLGVSFNGFVGIGMDDGTGAPYVFENNTHYFVGDYTAGGWETWETYDFNNNGMIRATGMESAVASYAVETTISDATSDFTMVTSDKATLTGTPDWTAPAAPANRSFTGYNIFRGADLIEEGYQETTYTDTEGLVNGSLYCYTVTAVYTVCGESDPSNEACVSGYVGIPTNGISEVSVYPNPATSLVNVTSSQEMTRISVINYVGQIVYQSELNNETTVQLNTSSFEKGVYVVRIDTENGVVTKRVIIAQ